MRFLALLRTFILLREVPTASRNGQIPTFQRRFGGLGKRSSSSQHFLQTVLGTRIAPDRFNFLQFQLNLRVVEAVFFARMHETNQRHLCSMPVLYKPEH